MEGSAEEVCSLNVRSSQSQSLLLFLGVGGVAGCDVTRRKGGGRVQTQGRASE